MGHKFCLAQSGTKEKKESGLARSEVDNFNIKCESYSKNNLYGKELLFFFLHPFRNWILENTMRHLHYKGPIKSLVHFLNFTSGARGTNLSILNS